jgi:hypothetical protein
LASSYRLAAAANEKYVIYWLMLSLPLSLLLYILIDRDPFHLCSNMIGLAKH